MKATLVIALLLAATVVGLGRAAAATTSSATVSTAASKLGRILVDGRGRTLYLFEKDSRGHSSCAGACAGYWPPLLVKGKPTADTGREAGAARNHRAAADGTTQVTYAGHPLYRFVQDTRPGQTTGQDLHDFGAGWYVLAPAGTKIENGS